ncbi:hypothetical protein [Croceibacter atlanticus]
MKQLLLVFLGGGLGSVARYTVVLIGAIAIAASGGPFYNLWIN